MNELEVVLFVQVFLTYVVLIAILYPDFFREVIRSFIKFFGGK